MIKIPAFFFPTTVLILDDDKHFLNTIKMFLDEYFNIVTFNTYDEISKYIKEETIFIEEEKARKEAFFPLSNAKKVNALLDSGKSHNLVSVVVSDYKIGALFDDHDKTGLDVLKEIRSPFVQKILMSSFVDSDIIKHALKNKNIDMYLEKLSGDFTDKLKESIKSLQRQFFINYSEQVFDSSLRKTKICDQSFANYIDKIIQRFNITQIVANDSLSMFEMESQVTREKIYLHAAEAQDFDDLINSMQGENAPEAILSRIKQKMSIPCFNNGKIPDGSLWAEYMKPVIAVHGAKSYYISCYTKSEGISLHAN